MKAWVLRVEGGGAPLRVYLDHERAVEDYEIALEANRGNGNCGPWKLDELFVVGPVPPYYRTIDQKVDDERHSAGHCEKCDGAPLVRFHGPERHRSQMGNGLNP